MFDYIIATRMSSDVITQTVYRPLCFQITASLANNFAVACIGGNINKNSRDTDCEVNVR